MIYHTWEHKYYIDFKNTCPAFINNFLDNLVNWDFIAANFAAEILTSDCS
jgi:Fe-Mn family superoxide dismutase